VLKLVEEKIKTNDLFPSVYDFEQKILINCVHFYKFWKMCSTESWYFSFEKRYTYC